MAKRPPDLSAVLVERIESSHPAPAEFQADEIEDWPDGALPKLISDGILQVARHATAVICPGCEHHCRKEVVVRAADTVGRAFVVCDEEPDYGRISLEMTALRQWHLTLRSLAVFIARALSLPDPPMAMSADAYLLGAIKGRYGPRDISIGLLDGKLTLHVGTLFDGLRTILKCDEGGIRVDLAIVRRLTNRKQRSTPIRRRYVRNRSRQALRARQTVERDRLIYQKAKDLGAYSGTSVRAIADELATLGVEFKGRTLRIDRETLRRIITRERTREQKN